MSGRAIVLLAALALGLAVGVWVYAGRGAGPADGETAPAMVRAEASAGRGACVRDVLPLSKAVFDWATPDYALNGEPGRLDADEFARAVPRLSVASLAEGEHVVTVGGTAHSFTIDRAAPRLVGTDPPSGTCPGPSLRVTLADAGACAPITCRLTSGGAVVAEAAGMADAAGYACALDVGAAEAGGAWSLLLRDGAGNASRHRLDWPTPSLRVEAPPHAAPGETVTARAIGEPAGGTFAARLLASEPLAPRVRTEEAMGRSTARIAFDVPADAQIVGIDVAYRLAPGCPPVRPVPAEVEVVEDRPPPASRGSVTLLGGAGPRPASCGNGVVDPGEACDAGEPSGSCDADCTLPRCSDGVLNPLAGEQCEPGGLTPGCSDRCTLSCGNGQRDEGEACDGGGETARCDLDCTPAVCGDGITNFAADEQCDDGNTSDGDGCDARCQVPADFEEEDPAIPGLRVL